MSHMETAAFVKSSRVKLKLTQAELGEKVGKERRSIMRYEAGDELPQSVELAIKHLLAEWKMKTKKKKKQRMNGSNGGR